MFKQTLTLTDFDGDEYEETVYFHLSKSELFEWENSVGGGMRQHLETIVKSKDNVKIMAAFKDILHRSYGVKSPDGKRFIKSEEAWLEFEQSPAYDELFFMIVSDADYAAKFIDAISPAIPQDHKKAK